MAVLVGSRGFFGGLEISRSLASSAGTRDTRRYGPLTKETRGGGIGGNGGLSEVSGSFFLSRSEAK